MNKITQANRPKRIRLAAAKTGVAQPRLSQKAFPFLYEADAR